MVSIKWTIIIILVIFVIFKCRKLKDEFVTMFEYQLSGLEDHKPRKKVKRSRNKKPKKGSFVREEYCRQILETYFNEPFPSARPKFLKNPKTGKPLELDGYNPKRNLAFEHNGKQHYVFPNSFHKTEEEFLAQKARDKHKKLMCEKLGIDLIIIPYNINKSNIENFIHEELIDLGH